MKLKSEASINWHIVIFVEDNSLCLLLNKLHLFSTTQHRFIVIQLLHLHVAHMFRRVLRPSSDKEIQKPYKIFLCMVFIVIVYSSVRFLYLHAWGWPKYRPKHVAHTFRPVLRPSSDKEIQKPYKIFLCMVFIVIVYSSVRFLYWHAWGWPKYRPKHVAHMFRPVLRPSSDIEIQKPYKIFLCMVFIVIVYSSVRFLYWHAWGRPKYRPKHVAHTFRPVLRPSWGMSIQKPYKIFLCMVFLLLLYIPL